MKAIYFSVITKVPEDDEGNLACSEILIKPDSDEHLVGSNIVVNPNKYPDDLFVEALKRGRLTTINLTRRRVLFCLSPVFRLGEILIMDSANDRTIPDGRKPGKWNVEYENFDDLDSAIKRAKKVLP